VTRRFPGTGNASCLREKNRWIETITIWYELEVASGTLRQITQGRVLQIMSRHTCPAVTSVQSTRSVHRWIAGGPESATL